MTIYDIDVTTIDGERHRVDRYRGRTLLIVNVASRCASTPQYVGLEELYRKYRELGFVVLGFPCNQFGREEPGSESEIKQFCSMTYGVTFPMFAKIDVNGRHAHALYRYLKAEKRGLFGSTAIKWNFTKFLVSSSGRVVGRFGPWFSPARLEPAIARALAPGRSNPAAGR